MVICDDEVVIIDDEDGTYTHQNDLSYQQTAETVEIYLMKVVDTAWGSPNTTRTELMDILQEDE